MEITAGKSLTVTVSVAQVVSTVVQVMGCRSGSGEGSAGSGDHEQATEPVTKRNDACAVECMTNEGAGLLDDPTHPPWPAGPHPVRPKTADTDMPTPDEPDEPENEDPARSLIQSAWSTRMSAVRSMGQCRLWGFGDCVTTPERRDPELGACSGHT